MIFVHLGAGAGDLDSGANFRCGVTEFIKKNSKSSDKIFLLEANPKNIPKLKSCYKKFPNAKIFNLGITTKRERKLNFFYTEDDAPHYQVCTTRKSHLKKHYPNSQIKTFSISTITINEFLKKKVKSKIIDCLSIDLEGMDYESIMSINIKKKIIENISIEFIHMNKFQKRNMINHLTKNGYSYAGYGYDHNNFDLLFVRKKIFLNRILSKLIWLISIKYLKFLNYLISVK
tara:strand:- start:88 stop:780 length:693 start_codon:yes stop_codon:yes gene_type:complete